MALVTSSNKKLVGVQSSGRQRSESTARPSPVPHSHVTFAIIRSPCEEVATVASSGSLGRVRADNLNVEE